MEMNGNQGPANVQQHHTTRRLANKKSVIYNRRPTFDMQQMDR